MKKRKWIKLTKIYWITLLIMIILFFTPYLLTFQAPAADGTAVIGFPLYFYSHGGGFCISEPCSDFFSITNITIDILLILLIPILAEYTFQKIKKK